MANVKITDLTAVTTPAASDLLEIVNSGANKKIQRQHLFYGTQTNDNAAAGYIGEVVTANLGLGSPASLTTATPANIVSISLTAGDWDVSAQGFFNPAVGTVLARCLTSVSTTSATLDLTMGRWAQLSFPSSASGFAYATSNAVPCARFSLAATTTVYLVVQGDFTTSTLGGYGYIIAQLTERSQGQIRPHSRLL